MDTIMQWLQLMWLLPKDPSIQSVISFVLEFYGLAYVATAALSMGIMLWVRLAPVVVIFWMTYVTHENESFTQRLTKEGSEFWEQVCTESDAILGCTNCVSIGKCVSVSVALAWLTVLQIIMVV